MQNNKLMSLYDTPDAARELVGALTRKKKKKQEERKKIAELGRSASGKNAHRYAIYDKLRLVSEVIF